ncbi:MAG: ABC transporter permease [Spirochaetales bacterium]
MKRIGRLIRKEFLQVRRDRRMLPIIFVSPILQLLLLGYAANLDVRDVPLLVCDMDDTVESRAVVDSLFAAGYFVPAGSVSDYRQIEGRIDAGLAQIGIGIPRGFGASLYRQEGGAVQVLVDGADANSAGIALSYAVSILQNRIQELGSRVRAAPPAAGFDGSGLQSSFGRRSLSGVEGKIHVWFNPDLRSRNYFVPGILALLLMVLTMLLTSLAVVKEKERGTLEQLSVTPIRKWEFILGKLIPFAIIGFIDVLLVLAAARFLFGLKPAGNPFLLLGLSCLFLLSTLGLGLLVSTLVRNQQQAMMSSVFFVLMPMLFLSGFIFPIDTMPRVIQGISYLLPLRYYFVIIRGIFLKGAGIEALWDQALILFGLGVGILSLSILRFRKRGS